MKNLVATFAVILLLLFGVTSSWADSSNSGENYCKRPDGSAYESQYSSGACYDQSHEAITKAEHYQITTRAPASISAQVDESSGISSWLRSIGLEKFEEAFLSNDITPDILPEITNDDLKEMGINSLGARKRILKAIKEGPALAPAEDTDAAIKDSSTGLSGETHYCKSTGGFLHEKSVSCELSGDEEITKDEYDRLKSQKTPPEDEAHTEVWIKKGLAQALTNVEGVKHGRAFAFLSLANAQTEIGDIDGARQSLAKAFAESNYSSTLSQIAAKQLEVDDSEGAAKSLSKALTQTNNISVLSMRAEALRDMANIQSEAGDIHWFKHILTQTLSKIMLTREPDGALSALAVAMARVGPINWNVVNAIRILDPYCLAMRDIASDVDDLDTALAITLRAREKSSWCDSYMDEAWVNIATKHARLGNITDALFLATGVVWPKVSANVFVSIADIQLKTGDIEGARQSLSEAFTKAKLIENSDDSIEVLGNISVAYQNAKDTRNSQETILFALDLVNDKNGRPYLPIARALTNMAASLLEVGGAESSKKVLLQALSYAKLIEDPIYRAYQLLDIAPLQVWIGDTKGALSTLSAVDKVEDIPVDRRLKALAKIAVAQARIGEIDRALATTKEIENSGSDAAHLFAETLIKIAIARAEEGDGAQALSFVERMKELLHQDLGRGAKYYRTIALSGIVAALASE